MERTMKRWLALLLAVVMTVSLFPTGALAARWDAETPETPAVDGTQVVDAQKKDDGEQPEIPVGPDDPVTAARDLWTISLDELTTDGHYTITVSANGQTPNDVSGDAVLAIVPNLRGSTTAKAPRDLIGSRITGEHASAGAIAPQIAYAGLPAGVSFFVDVNFKMENGTYVLEGDLDGFDFSAIENALDGKAYLANEATLWTKGGRLEFVAILVTAGAPPGVTSDVKDVGGGLADAVWIVNINGSIVTSQDGTEDTNGSYDPDTYEAEIPLYNTSSDKLWIGLGSSELEEIVTITSGNDVATLNSGPDISIGSDDVDTLTFTLSNPQDGQVFEVTVPNYIEKDGAFELVGTAKVTVYIVNEGLVADPLTFYVTVGSDEVPSIKAGTASTQGIRIPGAASGYVAETAGNVFESAIVSNEGEEYGLSFNWGDAVQLADENEQGWATWDDDEGWTDCYDVYVVSGSAETTTGEAANATSRVTLNPGKATVSSWKAGTYPGNIQISMIGDTEGNTWGYVLIPVTIIVEVADADTFTVTFEPNGGKWSDGSTNSQTESVVSGNSATGFGQPTKDYNTFSKWTYEDGSEYNPSDPVTRNITVTAQWDPIQYTVTFNKNESFWGGTDTTSTDSGVFGAAVSFPSDPSQAGYRFDGWYTAKTGGTKVTSATFPANNTTTYYAHWTENTVKITVQLNGSNSTVPAGSNGVHLVNGGTSLNPKASSSGGDFDFGPLVAGTIYDVTINGTKVGTLTAAAGPNVGQKYEYFTYTFDLNDPTGGTGTISWSGSDSPNTGVLKDTTVTYAEPTLAGWTFNGWKINDAATNWTGPAAHQITTETTFTAQWGRNTTSVTFHWDNGTAQTVVRTGESGTAVPTGQIPTPSRTGYSWDSKWYTDTTYTTEATLTFPDSGNKDVYAKLVQKNYEVRWHSTTGAWSGGVTEQTTSNLHYGDKITEYNPAPMKTGYTLEGWYTEDTFTNKVTFSSTGPTMLDVDAGLDYYAKWTADDCTIKFYRNYDSFDSTLVDTWTRKYDSTLGTLPAPDRTNYTFDGWWTARTGGSQITAGTEVKGDAEYFAHWTQKTGTIRVTVNLDDARDNQATAASDLHTVKLYQVGTGTGGADQLIDTKTGNSGQYDFTGVPFNVGEANYYFTVEKKDALSGAKLYTSAKTIAFANTDADGAVKSPDAAQYYTATVQTAGNGDATMSVGGTKVAETDYTNGTMTDSIIVVTGTAVTWNAINAALNYGFVKWTPGDDGNETKSVTVDATGHDYTANFDVNAYTGTLVLTQDGVPVTDTTTMGAGQDIVSITIAKKSGPDANPASMNPTYVGGKWQVSSLPKENDYTWTVQTRTGSYTADVTYTNRDATKAVFKVSVTGNAPGGPTPTINGGTAPIVVPAGKYALTSDRQTGYDFVNWVKSDGTALPTGLSATETELTIGGTYAGTTGGITIKPTFTYWVKVQVQNSAGAPLGGYTPVVNGTNGSPEGSTTGLYKFSSLADNTTTYKVWANGFESNVEVGRSNAGQTVNLKMYTVSVAMQTEVGGVAIDGTVNISKGDTASGTGPVYLPQGAKTSDTVTAQKVTITAGTGTKYRLKSPPWAADTYVYNQNNATTQVKTPATGIADNITIYADFMRQYPVKSTVEGVTSPSSTATLDDTTATTKTVDMGTVVKVTFTKGFGETLTGWRCEDGDLYSNSAGTTPLPAGSTDTTVYFKPSGDSAEVIATVVSAKYKVKVTVNQDNGELTSGIEVYVKNDATNVSTKLSYDATDKWNEEVDAGNYTVWTNVANGKGTNTSESAVKKIQFNMQDGEAAIGTPGATGNAENLKATVNYYTVQLVANPKGSTGKENGVRFDGQSTYAEKIVLAKSGAAVTVVATPFRGEAAGETEHYRFDDWVTQDTTMGGTWATTATEGKETYTLPDEATLTGKTTPIVLEAKFKQQYKVEVKLADTSLANASVSIKVEGASSWSTGSILVDDDKRAEIRLTETDDKLIFGKWTIDSGNGTFANGSGPASPTLGVEPQDFFDPGADSVLLAHLWRLGELKAGWQYDPTEKTGVMGTAQIPVKELEWTKNSGSDPVLLDGVKVEKKEDNADYSDATTIPLSAGDLVQDGTDKTKYTFKSEFLDGLKNGDYRVTFTYKLGEDGNKNQIATQTVDTEFYIRSTKVKLKQVDIQVENGTGQQTANVDASTNRDDVNYKIHTAVKTDGSAGTIAQEDLTFTWYYTKTKPGNIQKDYATEALANAARPAGWTAIGTATSWADGGNTINVAGNTTLEAGYIFAVVTASGERSEGAVITNVIPVDYTAKVVVKEDDKVIDAKGRYEVYLWPTDAGGTFSTSSSSAIQASWNGTSKKFEATATGDKSYYIYAATVESGTAYQRVGNLTITGGEQEKEIKYYTVNAIGTGEKHVSGLGEDLDAKGKPTTVFAVKAGGETVGNGTAVLSGTTITASASKTWSRDTDYDYKWNWGSKVDNVANGTMATPPKDPDDMTYGTEGLASGSTGKDYTINETHWIGGQLEQWTYTVTGDVKTTGTGGQITGATLTTTDGHTFTATGATGIGNGLNGATVTFTGVPRTVAGSTKVANYTITATEAAGTTIRGYSAPSMTVDDWKTAGDSGDKVTVKSDERTGRFTIFVEETKKVLTLTDGHNSGDDKPISPNGSLGSDTSTHTDTGIWRNYDDLGWGETVTLTNTGNTPLNVTLKVTKSDGTVVYSGTPTGVTETDDGVVKIKNLNQLNTLGTAELVKDASLSFEFEVVNNNLNTWEGDTYTFTFSSKDAREGHESETGPTAIYKYVMVINPVTITSVTTKETGGTYEVIDFTIAEAKGKDDLTVATKSANNDTPSTTGDLIYTWYVAPWNAKVTMRADGVPIYTNDAVNPAAKRGQPLDLGVGTFADNGREYTPADGERGMALYLVLKGQNNATGFAVTPDITKSDPVVLVPYQGKIILREEDVQLTGETAPAGYTVVLRRRGAPAGTPDIKTVWDKTANAFVTEFDKEDGQLWARDPNDNNGAAWVYEVWASRVKGDPAKTLQDTGLTITVGTKTQTVDFYKVTIDPTHVTQNRYDSPTFTPAAGSALFLTDATLLDANKQPTAKTTDGAIAVPDDGYVQKGNNVTFTYPNWEKDYTLTWGGAVSGTAQPGADRTANRTYSAKDTPAVTTDLNLNLYSVQAKVQGPVGWVDYITMAIENVTFTTKSGAVTGDILGINSTSQNMVNLNPNNRINVSQTVTFLLPKSTDTVKYTVDARVPSKDDSSVTGWQYIYAGNTLPTATTDYTDHPAAHPMDNVAVTGTAADTYTVNLKGAGLSMTLTENSLPTKMTETVLPENGTASIPDGMDAQIGTVTQEITLPYNYGQYGVAQTVTMTIANGDDRRSIYNVQRTVSMASDTKITASGFDKVDEMVGKVETGTSSQDMTVTINPGLAVNSTPYTYNAKFTFTNDVGTKTAEMDYTLKINIKPLRFDTVTTKTNDATGEHSVRDYTVKVPTHGDIWTNDDGTMDNGTPSGNSGSGFTAADYAYQWVRADLGVTPTVTWAAGTLTVVDGSGNDLKIAGATSKTYNPDPTLDEGKALYLVIYATNGHNAKNFAISDAITMGYTGKIKINLDGNTNDLSGANDPGYKVWFVPASDSNKYVKADWNNTDGYTATLDPEEDYYTVKVGAFKGAADANRIDLEDDNGPVKITKDHGTDKAYYFTVHRKPFEQFDYITNKTGETIADAAKAIEMKVNNEVLPITDATPFVPVLKGQDVVSTTGACDKDYTRMWQSDGAAGNVSVAADTANKGTANSLTYTETISKEIYIGGRLKQNTYTLVGNIKSSKTGQAKGEVKSVTLYFQHGDDDTRDFSLTATAATNTGDHVFVDGTSDTLVNRVGDTVTFTVVKGAYQIVAMEGDNTVITSVTLGVDGVVTPDEVTDPTPTWATRNQVTMTQDQAVTGNGRIFNIYVEERTLSLKVEDNDGHEATSSTATAADDNKQATHAQVYYFSGVDTKDVPLTLTNTSNTDLSVSAAFTSVSSLAGVDFAAGNVGSAPGSGDKVTQTGLDFTDKPMTKGQKITDIGKLNAVANAANTDDKIFIVRFTSETTDTNGDKIDGPTVYYVFDLTIKPLDIVKVDAVWDGTNKVIRLDGSTNAADSGLDHVWVDHDGDGIVPPASPEETAKDHGIKDADVSYIWFSAPANVPETDVQNSFAWNAAKSEPESSRNDVKKGVKANNTGKSYSPDDTEQGLNFYLVAYRTSADRNTAEFAVSNAVYARVTVSLKAYRTGQSDKDALTGVQIWKTDDTSVISNNGTFVVTGNDDTSIGFTADKNDYLHKNPAGTPDDPDEAEYYFHHWAVKPLGGAEIDKEDDSVTTPVNSDRLQMTYDVTKQATVIGYYDLLPVLGGSTGYNTGSTAYDDGTGTGTTNATEEKKARTLEYTTNDGSGNVEIWIRPTGASKFVNGTTTPIKIANLGEVFEEYPATGADGKYVLKKTWITNGVMVEESGYEFVFYDLTKGEKAVNDGYEGYDRVQPFRPVGGEKTVHAQVEEKDGNYHGEVQVTKGSGKDGERGLTSEQATNGGQVTVTAYPDDGWKFKEWKLVTPEGGYFGTDEMAAPTTSTNRSDRFNAKKLEVWVEASFELAEFSATDNAKAAIYYGDDAWDGTAEEITVTGDPDPTVEQAFHLELPNYNNPDDTTEADALKKFLTDSGKTETEADAIVAKAKAAPAWLVLEETTDAEGNVTGAKFKVASNATGVNVVKDSDSEVVVYVKITETKATDPEKGIENIRYVPYTVDVMTAKLKIVTAGTQAEDAGTLGATTQPEFDGAAYRALYHNGDGSYAGEGKDVANGEKVLLEYFNYINVQNTRNTTDFADGDATGNLQANYAAGASRTQDPDTYGHVTNGYWEVTPPNFDGVNGGAEYVEGAGNTNKNEYKFTYHYTGKAADKSDALNYEETATIVLKIPVPVPSLSLKFKDEMKPTVTPDEDHPFDVRPATVDRDTEKGWGPYSSYDTADANRTESGAPLTLNLANDAWRNGEHITYLDNEPYYVVTLQKIGTIYNATLTEDENTKGFQVVGALPDIANQTDNIPFTVKLTALDEAGKLWAGEHKISFTAKGNSREDGTGTDVVATYTLVVNIDPKVIDHLTVELDEPKSGTTPDTTPTIDEEWTTVDAKGNTPIKPEDVEVVWKDKDGNPVPQFEEDNYTVTVTVPTDPNYIYASDDPDTEDENEDIVDNTKLNNSENGEDGTTVTKDDERTVTIEKPMKAPITIGATFEGFKREDAGKPVEDYEPKSKNDERYPITNEATYGEDWFWATSEDPDTPLAAGTLLEAGKNYVLTVKLDPNEDYAFVPFVVDDDKLATFNTNSLTDVASLAGRNEGVELVMDEDGNVSYYALRYNFTVPNPSSPPPPSCPYQVFYYLGLNGTTKDSTIEAVSVGGKPANVPEVTAIEGYTFLGWSLTRPEEGKEVQLVDPTAERITEDTTFYAVYEQNGPVVKRHTNYIVGFPNGTFGPEKDITRAQVATIIARAILPGFKERSDYGNIGNYSDVEGHWAASAIAYCSKYGVFKGYDDGTFQPNRSITRQELALVVARLDGISEAGELPFRDSEEVSSWALDGIFTAYDRGLIKGYDDGTFRPQNNIRRDEAVTIFNRYLKRGVDAKGLEGLTPYLYGETVGEAGSQYMVWPDVPETLWSYYEVIEASNDHEFYYVDQKSEVPPEHWTSCWIDGTWDDGSADKLNITATSLAITAKTSVPFVGTEAPAAYASAPTAWVGTIRTPLWVSKELEVQF